MKLFVIPAGKLGGRGGSEGDATHKGGRELRTEHLGISKRRECARVCGVCVLGWGTWGGCGTNARTAAARRSNPKKMLK